MTCLKCGRESNQTFCENCREVMKKYPVKPGSIVLLPKGRRAEAAKRNAARRNAVSSEVQIAALKKTIRRLAAAVAALAVTVVIMGFVIFRLVKYSGARPLGQNYSTVTKPAEDSEAAQTEEEIAQTAQTAG